MTPATLLTLAFLCLGTNAPVPLLMDGTLDAWQGDRWVWSLEEGVLVGATRLDMPRDHHQYLIWKGGATDFKLDLEIRVLGGRAGIQYRSQRIPHADRPDEITGYQAALDADNLITGALLEVNGRGLMVPFGRKRSYLFQDNQRDEGILPESDLRQIDPARWNTYTITAVGPHLTHHINGVLVMSAQDSDPDRRRDGGAIAFQLHSGPPTRVEIRNVWITPMHGTTLTTPDPADDGLREPEWIWASRTSSQGETRTFTRVFDLVTEPAQAVLRISCDNQFTAFLDGQLIGTGTDWTRPVEIDLTKHLQVGQHELRIEATNETGPAGLVASLEGRDEDGELDRLVTDSTWMVDDTAAFSFGPISNHRGPWHNVFDRPARQSRGTLVVPAGFEATMLYEAGPSEGSFVAMTFDESGRIMVSPQAGGLLRLTLPTTEGDPVRVETIDLDIGSAQGLLVAHDALYAVCTRDGAQGGGLWRLRDTTGDDRYDELEHLIAWGAGNEHGNHGLVLGPDGLIYIVQGNHTPLPPNLHPDSPHLNWAEDDLLPRLWDANGHAVGIMSPGGVILRTDADGTRCEIIAGGLRNAYDLAFNDTGDLFTWDSDMEWDLGTPWYRPPRALHVIPGAEFGWRAGTAKWPSWYPDSMPTLLDMPPGSPTGMVFGGDGNFPEPWRSALFLADWTYGRVFALHLEEDGSGWRGRREVFASGRPFNVTDLAFGPDGGLYLITGGRGTHSALYRIDSTGSTTITPPDRAPAARALREVRRSLAISDSPEAIVQGLTSPDRLIRYAARLALERTANAPLQEQLEQNTSSRILTALAITLARTAASSDSADPTKAFDVARRAIETADDLETRRDALRALALCVSRLGPTGSVQARSLAELVTPQMKVDDLATRRLATELLVALDAADLPEQLVTAMESADTQEDALHAALLLRLLDHDWNDALRKRYLGWLERNRSLTGGRSLAGFIAAIEADALSRWSEQERAIALQDRDAVQPPDRVAMPQINAHINAWNLDQLRPHLSQTQTARSFTAGRAAYRNARCLECHRFHGAGGTTGPDLTGVGARMTLEDLLEATVTPSSVISDQYLATMVILTDDTIETGRLLEDTSDQVTININPYGYEPHTIARSSIAQTLPSPVSTMPAGLLNTLTLEEVLDLLAYLHSGGDPSDAAFDPADLP